MPWANRLCGAEVQDILHFGVPEPSVLPGVPVARADRGRSLRRTNEREARAACGGWESVKERQMKASLNLALSADDRSELAGELAEDLARRGLTLGDVERLAPLMVERFRRLPVCAGGVPDRPRAAGKQGRGR